MSAPVTRRSRGFSLVELMVALVIGMLALMFATRIVLTGEQNKQASLGGSDAMQNGMLALFSITSDVNQAGFGINDKLLAGCNTFFIDSSGYQLAQTTVNGAPSTPLAAAVIQSNGTAPDQLSLYSGASLTGTGSMVISQHAGGLINVASIPYGFAQNDVIVATNTAVGDGNRCAISQITSDPAALAPPPAQQSLRIDGTGRFTSGGLFGATFTANASRVFNLGPANQLAFHTWSVDKGFLRLRATEMAGASLIPQAVVDNVVSLKAQYGFDMRTGIAFQPNAGMVIGRWSPTMVDADGNGTIGNRTDYQHIAALRVAVVARSKTPEKPDSAGLCSATTVLPKVFAAESPPGVAPVPINVDVAVANDPIAWQCYRYRVFETIVPLRNAGWRAP